MSRCAALLLLSLFTSTFSLPVVLPLCGGSMRHACPLGLKAGAVCCCKTRSAGKSHCNVRRTGSLRDEDPGGQLSRLDWRLLLPVGEGMQGPALIARLKPDRLALPAAPELERDDPPPDRLRAS